MSAAEKNPSISISDKFLKEVSKSLFYEGMILPVTIYLKLNADSYLPIGKKNDKANFSDLHAYLNPKSQVFVLQNEYNFFVDYVTKLTEKIVSQKNIPGQVKARYLTALTDQAVTYLSEKNFASVAQLQVISKVLVDYGQKTSSFDDILNFIGALPNDESRHSMATCMVSLMICDEMQLSHSVALEKVALGALLHDIGLRYVPRAILDKPKHLWSAEDLQVYEQHPIKGVEMLRDFKDISDDVLLIVAEHHENSVGRGFPKKMRDVKISPLSRIVGVANYFCDLVYGRNEFGKKYSADEAISFIDEVIGQPFNKQVFLALKNIINKKNMSDKK